MVARQSTKLKDHRVLALDIGSRFIKVAELRYAKGTISLLNIAITPTPADMVDRSSILDPVGLGLEIKRLLLEQKITTRAVVASVKGQSSLVVRPIDLPKMSAKELKKTMKFEVERHVPFSADEVIMDFAPLVDPQELPETEENMKVLLAVAQEDLILSYVKMLRAAKLTPVALDVEVLAAMRSLVDIHRDQGSYEETLALVNIGSSSTDISIVSDGNLAFTRSIPIAGDSLTNAIAEQMGRSFDEAEEVKKAHARIISESMIGELPLPMAMEAGAANGSTQPADDVPFFSKFGQVDGAMDTTIAWDNSGTAPQQVFSLEDEPVQPVPVPQAEEKTPFVFDADADDDDTARVFDLDTPDTGDTISAKAATAPPLFDLSSELEGQMPPPLARPVFDNSEPAQPLPVAPATLTPQEQRAPEDFMAALNADKPLPAAPMPVSANGESSDPFQRRIFDAMQPTLVEMSSEIRRSLEFYANREPEHPVTRLVIYGGTCRMPDLIEFIKHEVGIDVAAALPLQAIDLSSCRQPAEYIQDLAPVLPVVIGLGLRDMLT